MDPRVFLKKLTNDDYPWGAECTAEQLLAFLSEPSKWLHDHVSDKCFLPTNFVIRIRKSTVSPPQKDHYQLMGNNGTNFVMLYVPDNGLDSLNELLMNMAREDNSVSSFMKANKLTTKDATAALVLMSAVTPVTLDIQIVMEKGANRGRAHCHFPITSVKPNTQYDKLWVIATFVKMLLTDKTALHTILTNATIRNKTYIDPEGADIMPTPTDPISFTPFTTPDDVAIEYICNQGNNLIACEMLIALYEAGVITAEEAYIKDYS